MIDQFLQDKILNGILNPFHMFLIFTLLGGVHFIRYRNSLSNGQYKLAQTAARIVVAWSFSFIWLAYWIGFLDDMHFRTLARFFVWILAAGEIAFYLDVIIIESIKIYRKFMAEEGRGRG